MSKISKVSRCNSLSYMHGEPKVSFICHCLFCFRMKPSHCPQLIYIHRPTAALNHQNNILDSVLCDCVFVLVTPAVYHPQPLGCSPKKPISEWISSSSPQSWYPPFKVLLFRGYLRPSVCLFFPFVCFLWTFYRVQPSSRQQQSGLVLKVNTHTYFF